MLLDALAVAASMRRLPPVKKIIVDGLWGLRGLPLAEFEAAPHARVARSSSAYPLHPPILPNAPFPSSQLFSLRPEGKGLGVSGACPWRSLRQLLLLPGLCLCRLSSLRLCRHASIRTRSAVLQRRRCLWCSQFMGVLPSRRTAGSQLPGFRRAAATSQSPQLGAFAYSAEIQSLPISFLSLPLGSYVALGCAAEAATFPLAACLAVVPRIAYSPSPTTYAATPPASAPPPPPPSSSASCCLLRVPPCTFVSPHARKSVSALPPARCSVLPVPTACATARPQPC